MELRSPAVTHTHALRRALEAGLDDEALAPLLADAGAWGRLWVALAHTRKGRLRSARREVRAALSMDPRDATVRSVAGLVSFVLRDYSVSLEHLRAAARLDRRSAPELLRLRAELAGSLGWDREQLEALEAWREVTPGSARAPLRAARLHAMRRDWEGALVHLDRASCFEGASKGVPLARATVLVELGRWGEAVEALAREGGISSDWAASMQAGSVSRRCGRFEHASEHFERACELACDQPAPRVGLAELALWHRDFAEASVQALRALELAPDCGAALRVLGVVRHFEGAEREARELLERAVQCDPGESEAHVWLAEFAMHRGDTERADRALGRAVATAEGYAFSALIVRFLFALEGLEPSAPQPFPRVSPAVVQEIFDSAVALDPSARATLEAGELVSCRALARRLLDLLGTNRSTCATFERDGVLHALPYAPGMRFRSRLALQLFRLRGPVSVRALLEALAARHPRWPLALCHLGEAELWAGEYARARRALTDTLAIERSTRWAWIGLTAVEALTGDPRRALAVSEEGIEAMGSTVGPAVYAHRGDAHRLAGSLHEARADLERAVSMHPRRVSARIGFALVLWQLGDPEGMRAHFEQLCATSPGLVSDASRETDVCVWGDPGDAPSDEERVAVLTRALEMLRGNRSASSVTYFTCEGALRACEFGDRARGLHAQDAALLERASQLLEHALGTR